MLGDPDQVYGDAWLLVYQVETKESLLKAIQDKIDVRLSRHRVLTLHIIWAISSSRQP